MLRFNWLHQLSQRWFSLRGTARQPRSRRISSATRQCVKPRLEALEDRCVPTAVTYHDGPIMNNVQVENIFYGSAWNTPANQQLQQRINQFTAYLVQSPYMDMLNQYYGNGLLFGNNYVGRGSLYGSKVYEGSVSGTVATQDIVNNLIAGVLGPNGTGGGGLPALPSFDNLYIVYLPPGISNDLALELGAYAYHSSIFLGQPPWNIPPDAPVPNVIQYVIAPYPGQGNPQPPYISNQFNALTVAISHELAESVTDPNLIWANQSVKYANVGTGWYETTGTYIDPTTGKTVVRGQEIGDLAEGYTGLLNGYLVQAEWSNAANGPVLPSGSIWKTIGSGSSSIIGADTPGAMTGPQGKPDSYAVANNLNLFVNSAQGVLANDTDVFNNPLRAVLVNKPSHGQLLYFNPDGSFAYSPAAGYVGTDTFAYVPSDGTINGKPVTVTITVIQSVSPPPAPPPAPPPPPPHPTEIQAAWTIAIDAAAFLLQDNSAALLNLQHISQEILGQPLPQGSALLGIILADFDYAASLAFPALQAGIDYAQSQ
jgi:hypothetical protein